MLGGELSATLSLRCTLVIIIIVHIFTIFITVVLVEVLWRNSEWLSARPTVHHHLLLLHILKSGLAAASHHLLSRKHLNWKTQAGRGLNRPFLEELGPLAHTLAAKAHLW